MTVWMVRKESQEGAINLFQEEHEGGHYEATPVLVVREGAPLLKHKHKKQALTFSDAKGCRCDAPVESP